MFQLNFLVKALKDIYQKECDRKTLGIHKQIEYKITMLVFLFIVNQNWTAFLGYLHSPKWFNISVSYFYIFIILSLAIFCIYKIKEDLIKKGNTQKVLEIKKINQKCVYRYSLEKKRAYSTSCSVIKNIDNCSDRLKTIIKEIGLNPVYLFEDLNLEDTKKQIVSNTKGLSGIYMIVNKITKDSYIGSASTDRFYPRFCNHLIYFRGSKIVKLAVRKYKLDNFAFLILDIYPKIVNKENNKELIDLEDKYLKLFLPNYNILTEAGSSFGYKHTEIDRIKMKDVYSEARREQIGSLNRGKKLSNETIEKIREKALNRAPMSAETKQKCLTHTRPVVLYNLNGSIYGKYSTILEAALAINCQEKTIRRALQTEKKLVKRL